MFKKTMQNKKPFLKSLCVEYVFFGSHWGQLYLQKAISQCDYSELNIAKLFLFITTLTFSSVQRNRCLITEVFPTPQCKRNLELIIYSICLTENFAVCPCLLKTVENIKKGTHDFSKILEIYLWRISLLVKL